MKKIEIDLEMDEIINEDTTKPNYVSGIILLLIFPVLLLWYLLQGILVKLGFIDQS